MPSVTQGKRPFALSQRTDLKALTSRGTVVASVELKEGYNEGCLNFLNRNKSGFDYKLKALKELYTTAQLASFGTIDTVRELP
eukprot:COSAG02_NODE_40048_length_409_cov_1.819355_1_plen_83_part_00